MAILSVLYLVFAAIALILGINAVRPPMTLSSPVLRPPWLPVMLTNELAPLGAAVVGIVTALAVGLGVTDGAIGRIGLVMGVAAFVLLVWQVARASRTLRVMRRTLDGISGVDAPRYDWGAVMYPYPYRLGPGIERIDDLAYAPGLSLDLYRSSAGGAPSGGAPLLIHVHGGSWGGGHRRQQAQPLIQEMARRGWVVASVDYPLVPVATFPDQVIALHGALRWLRDHADAYGIDATRIFVTGGSAGAHLASLVALTDRQSEWSARHEGESPIAGAVTIYGVYDLLDRNGIRDFWPIVTEMLIKADPDTEPGKFHDGSPIDHVDASAPPFLIVHGDHDSLVPIAESAHFAEALAAVSRQPALLATIPGATHGFDVVRSLRTQQLVAGIAAFLDAMAMVDSAHPRTQR
jgi:acetyl esterase/lipase